MSSENQPKVENTPVEPAPVGFNVNQRAADLCDALYDDLSAINREYWDARTILTVALRVLAQRWTRRRDAGKNYDVPTPSQPEPAMVPVDVDVPVLPAAGKVAKEQRA